MLKVEPAPAVTDVGLKPAVAPAGTPEIVRAIICALPEIIAVEMEAVLDPPGARLKPVGLAKIEKSLLTVGPNAPTPLGVPRPVGPS